MPEINLLLLSGPCEWGPSLSAYPNPLQTPAHCSPPSPSRKTLKPLWFWALSLYLFHKHMLENVLCDGLGCRDIRTEFFFFY